MGGRTGQTNAVNAPIPHNDQQDLKKPNVTQLAARKWAKLSDSEKQAFYNKASVLDMYVHVYVSVRVTEVFSDRLFSTHPPFTPNTPTQV